MVKDNRKATMDEDTVSLMTFPLIIGTAQLGMAYGIANEAGRPDESVALDMVGTALKEGVFGFDTAQAYGESEALLGRAFRTSNCSQDVKVISKFSPEIAPDDVSAVAASVGKTLEKLGLDSIYCMMLHRFEWLSHWDRGLGEGILKERARGRMKHIGVSVYSPSEARTALAHPEVDAIQVPCNAWDRSMIVQGIFEKAASLGKRVFVRSAYLQGLLLMPPEKVKQRLPRAYDASTRWWELSKSLGTTPQELAVRFVLSLHCPIIVGAETVGQLTTNIRLFRMLPMPPEEASEIERVMTPFLNEKILNPVNWSA